jgi:hypothetical protein
LLALINGFLLVFRADTVTRPCNMRPPSVTDVAGMLMCAGASHMLWGA